MTGRSASFPAAAASACNDGAVLALLPRERLDHRRSGSAGPAAPQIVVRTLSVDGESLVAATAYLALPEVEGRSNSRPTIDMITFAAPVGAMLEPASSGMGVTGHAVAMERAIAAAFDQGRPQNADCDKELPDIQIAEPDRRDAREHFELALATPLREVLRVGGQIEAEVDAAPLTFLVLALDLAVDVARANAVSASDRVCVLSLAGYGAWLPDTSFQLRCSPPKKYWARVSRRPDQRRILRRLRWRSDGRSEPTDDVHASDRLKQAPLAPGNVYTAAFESLCGLRSSQSANLQKLAGIAADIGLDANAKALTDAVVSALSHDRRRQWRRDKSTNSFPRSEEDLEIHLGAVRLLRSLLLNFDSDDAVAVDEAVDLADRVLGFLAGLECELGWRRPA